VVSSSRWYEHVPAATAVIPCEGEEHRLTWRWGKLKLDDHDLGSERAMLVLGGQASACLRALGLWESQFAMPPEHFLQMHRWLGPDAVLAPKEFDLPRQVGVTLSWERAWKRSVYLDKHGQLLERMVRDKAVPALRAHLTEEKQRFGTRSIRTVEVRHLRAGQPPGLRGRMDSVSVSVSAALSSDWIVRVWAAGLATVPGAFVLQVNGRGSRAPGSLAVLAVRWKQVQPGVGEAVTEAAEAVRTPEGWRLDQPVEH
jgi:hypothetical protein